MPGSHARFAARVLLLAGLAGPATAQSATRLLCLDRDAHADSNILAGALFSLDLTAATADHPDIELAGDINAPLLESVVSLGVSPLDGSLWFTDIRSDEVAPGRIFVMACDTGTATLLVEDPLIQDPFDLTFLPDGRLLVVDWDADPSGLGADDVGGFGHGALFWVDTSTGALSLLADGTVHSAMPAVAPGESAFQDPIACVHDPVSGDVYVVDLSADPLGLGYFGALFAVDPATGNVDLITSSSAFWAVVSAAVRPDGTPLVVDVLLDDSVLWAVDPSNGDPEANFWILTEGAQYAQLDAVAVDATDRVFVADTGEFDTPTGTFLQIPRILSVDETNPDTSSNAVLVNDSVALVTPLALAVDPACPDPQTGLSVSYRLPLTPAPTAAIFEYVIAGPTTTLIIPGETAALGGAESIWFYQHSANVLDLLFRKQGTALAVSP